MSLPRSHLLKIQVGFCIVVEDFYRKLDREFGFSIRSSLFRFLVEISVVGYETGIRI